MPMNASFVPEEELLVLMFDGNLDLTLSNDVFGVVPRLSDDLKTCIMDLTQVDRMFDSGIALLRMLSGTLRAAGTTVVVLSDHLDERRRVSLIQADATYPVLGAFERRAGWSRWLALGPATPANVSHGVRPRTDFACS